MDLEFQDIRKSFGPKTVLDGVSFHARSGEALGLLGRNGAGKTTSIRILMGVFPADGGRVLLDGAPIDYGGVSMGYLPEERGLYPKKKIGEQLVYFAQLNGMTKSGAAKAVDRWLDRLGMAEYRDKRLDTLSKGNQQKIQLITALAHDPDIIILDEPFSGLDPVNAMLLKDVVKEELDRGKTEGLAPDQAADILSFRAEHTVEALGADQGQNFFYTYIMIFALYMVILLYGQMVANGVATEKSSRAMELLITSAKPVSMMFGKVIAACLAGLFQLVCVFGAALLFYRLNRAAWGDNMLMGALFDMPPALLGYMLLYFVLGFFLYAFLFGAVGSTATKLEDINTSVMPIMLVFIAGFIVVVFAMSSGTVNSALMKVCSYVPFTSPMAMFTRIAMSTVPWYEIALSALILALSVFGVGVLAARIYRVGVLLYGASPKLRDILRSLRRA